MAPIFSRLCCASNLRLGQCHSSTRMLRRERRHKEYFQLAPKHEALSDSIHFQKLFKPFVFTVCFSGSSFVLAAIWKYENMRNQALRFSDKQWNWWNEPVVHKKGRLRQEINTWWNQQTDGQKVAWKIIAANAVVLCLWRVPALQPTLIQYFCSNIASKAVCWPMLLSTFSHYSLIHWAVNMYVLHSFSTTAVAMFGKEQFMAFYLSAGVFSSLTSYICKVVTGGIGFSLGASGSLLAVIAAVCTQYPESQMQIVFLPFFNFSADIALKTVIALDTTGMLLRWKIIDHAAHLGGSIFGILYTLYGQEQIWNRRAAIIKPWHEWRQNFTK